MSWTIWKIDITSQSTIIELPAIYEPLKVGYQHNELKMWLRVETGFRNKVYRVVTVVGTGHSVNSPEDSDYVGTVFQDEFVWHVFISK